MLYLDGTRVTDGGLKHLAALKRLQSLYLYGTRVGDAGLKDLAALKELLQSGNVKPAIDRSYALADTAEALRYLGRWHAKGKVVVTMDKPAIGG